MMILGGLLYLVSHRDTTRLVHARTVATNAALAVMLATALGYIIQALVDRSRPYEVLGEAVRTIGMLPANSSFPSAHTWIASAFAATFLFMPAYVSAGYLLFSLALLVGIGRVMVGFHYPSDIIAGALLGLVAASIVVHHGPRLFRWLAKRSRIDNE